MSIPDTTMVTSPPASTDVTPLPVKPTSSIDDVQQAVSNVEHVESNTTTLPASAASPINGMSPAHAPTESSRHSTPATSAAGSDHAHSTLPTSIDVPTSKASHDGAAVKPPEPSTPPSQPQPQPESQSQLQQDEHPLSSIQPAYFYPADGNASSSHDGIPVFEPTIQQFQDFYAFCQAIDSWGMQYGIVKVVPPSEWRDSLPDLRPTSAAASDADAEHDEHADLSKVRIRNAIMQHFTPAGSGVWRQLNTTRSAKIWNAKQWAQLCVSEDQKGPEMDRMKWKAQVEGASNGGWGPKIIGTKDGAPSAMLEEDGVRTRSGKARPSAVPAVADIKVNGKRKRTDNDNDKLESAQPNEPPATATPPPAPASPSSPERRSRRVAQTASAITKASPLPAPRDASPVKKKNWEAEATTHDEWRAFDYRNCWRKEALSQEQLAQLKARSSSTTAEASTSKLDAAATTDQSGEATAAGPSLPSPSEWTPEVCREIESEYWRNLNFGKPPMYGADLSGTLFDERTKHWNVGKLDSVLTRLRLRRKLPGVNTPYLYWGMWRATFAWHVEDMDLYSINYIHFGAPKQWYSIRQSDRQRFESAMAGAFPSDARRCPHFMRHKSYLASPSFLASHGIRPLKLVHNAGEFVITYPFGYHSGFNMGYNCAESVNFALESWLDIGRKANYCHCDMSQNSVRIDVDALLEESKEMEELERKRELRRAKEDAVQAVEEDELEKRRIRNERAKERRRLKKEAEEAAAAANPAVPLPFQGGDGFYIDPKQAALSPCVFCPANVETDLVATPAEIETTNSKLKSMSGRYAHRLCASFVPETWVGKHGKAEVVEGIEGIDKARFSLKCQICPNPILQKLYPKIQCTRGKCPRAAHVSCALVEEHGWFVDVCPGETADRLEGKKSPAASSAAAQQTDGLEDGERLVVLCKTHNPLFREAEEARKLEELRERIYALPIPSMVKIKTSGGMFQALMVEIREEEDEIVIEDEGRPSTVKFQQIILDDPIKQEPQAVAMTPVVDAAAGEVNEEVASQPNKRRRKASEKANANAQAAKEESMEASAAVPDAAASLVPSKKPRRSRGAAVAATAAAAADADMTANQSSPAAKKAGSTDGPIKPKRTRQPKKKVDATESEATALPPPPSMQWPGHPMYSAPQQQQPPEQLQMQPQQAQAAQAPSKRGPRATYAAQRPSEPQPPFPPQYAEHHAYAHHQHQQQHQQYGGPDGMPMHRGPSFEGGYHQQYAPGFGRSEYGPGGASPSYAHPGQQQQQQQRSSNGHPYNAGPPYQPYQQAPHPSYAPPQHPVTDSSNGARHPHPSASSTSSPSVMHPALSSTSQYGYISAPVGGYDRTPPLPHPPTYGKPLPHGGSEAGFPDYRGPYNHAAPAALHPAYQQYRGQPLQQQQQGPGYHSYGYPQHQQAGQFRPHHQPQHPQGHGMTSLANPVYANGAYGQQYSHHQS